VSWIRQRTVRGYYGLLERHIGRDVAVENLTQHAYVVARRSGAIESPRKRGDRPGVRGSIRSELQLLVSILQFGEAYKVNARPLLGRSPLIGCRFRRSGTRCVRSRPRTDIRSSSQ